MAINNRKEREIISYLPEDLVLVNKAKAYIDKQNKDSVKGIDSVYTKSQLVIDALNHFFRAKGIK